jgi:regulator of sigma E protease
LIETPGIVWPILFFVLAMSPLVFIHEMGHYLVGRWCGVKADVFSIGFGRAIAGWTDRRGTRWQVGWLPLGGYVRFAGDMSPVSEASDEWLALPPEERNKTFQSKAVWQRALIVLAGPAVNFLFAIIVLAGLFSFYGEPRIAPVVGAVQKGSAAEVAGLKTGDRIVAVEGQSIGRYEDIGTLIQVRAGLATTIDILRDEKPVAIVATPRLTTMTDLTGTKLSMGLLGITSAKIERVKLSLLELPEASVRFTIYSVREMVRRIGQIVFGQRSVRELGGPVKIAQVSAVVATFGLIDFIGFMAMISINLGFINLLPIPTLDGGHLMFYAAEAVRRKPLPMQAQEWAFRGGLALLLTFMIFVTANDLGLWARLGGLIG